MSVNGYSERIEGHTVISMRLAAHRLGRRSSKRASASSISVVVIVLSLRGSSNSISSSSLAVPVITMRFTTNRLSRRGSLSHDGREEAEKGDGESGSLHLGCL